MSTDNLIDENERCNRCHLWVTDEGCGCRWSKEWQAEKKRADKAEELLAAHTEPASGDVTLVQALRISHAHMTRDGLSDDPIIRNWWAKLTREADRLEAAQSTREADIRIGRRLSLATGYGLIGDKEHAEWGCAARSAVEAERGVTT